MPAPEIKQNLFPQEPSLRDVLDAYKKQTLLNLCCHHIGVLEEFDPEKQTARVSIAYKMTIFRQNELGEIVPQLLEYPILADCPVIFLRGGDGALTIPPQKGDECIVLFNDRSIDNWFAGNTGGEVNSQRTHHISDGLILIGPASQSKLLQDFDMERAVLRKGEAKLGVGKDGKLILIGNADVTLGQVFSDLTAQLKSLTEQIKSLTDTLAALTVTGVTTGPGVSGPPAPTQVLQIQTVGTQVETIGTQIEQIMDTQIAELLETAVAFKEADP